MSVSNFKNVKINYKYMECPKKEYYLVSNLSFEHEFDCIKPIGEFLVEFLNADLSGYEEGLKKIHDVVYKAEITSMLDLIVPFMNFMDSYVQKCGFLFGAYIYLPITCAFDTLAEYAQKNIPIYLPKKVYGEWYSWLSEYLRLYKRYKKFVNFVFNLDRKRFDTLNKGILTSYDAFPDISRTTLLRSLTSAPIKDGRFDIEYIRKINDMDIDIMEKSNMVYDESVDFKPMYMTEIHSLNEALFYEFSELVKNGYRINKCRMCKKYFLVITARDVTYCKNANESGFSCAQLASKEKYKESLNDTYLKEYSKISEKMYQRYYRVNDITKEEELSGKDLTFNEYDEWNIQAQALRKKYIEDRDKITKNTNFHSRQKYSKKQQIGEKFIEDLRSIPYPEKPGKRKSKGIIMS